MDKTPQSRDSRTARASAQYRVAREFARERKPLNFTWRLVVLVVGVSLLGLGVFFMLFPGPGWATIILGLIVLGSEYSWARRALQPIQSTASRLADRARNREATNKAFAIATSAIMSLTALTYIYLASFGLSITPIINSLRAIIPGLS